MEVETLGFHIHSKNMANFEVVFTETICWTQMLKLGVVLLKYKYVYSIVGNIVEKSINLVNLP